MTQHRTVMAQEAIDGLNVRSNHNYIDCTLGGGGHCASMLERSGPRGTVLAFDLDSVAIQRAKDRFASYKKRFVVQQSNFVHLKDVADACNIGPISGILYDLGLSMDLIKASGKGFTFMNDEPLDMRFDQEQELTAEEIVNRWNETEIADTLFQLGEERYSRRIAKAIVLVRKKQRIETTAQLVDVIANSVPAPYRHRKMHFATKTFQALRMAVNDELENLSSSLKQAMELVEPKGRIAAITFHSLEDRIVKQLFKKAKEEKTFTLINKKPLIPKYEEVKENPAARSAKLRIVEKN